MAYRSGKYTNAAYSYEEAKLYLEEYKKAVHELVSGQVQEYTIGSRSVTLLNLDELTRMVDKFAAIVSKYEGNSRPPRSVAVVFRDT